MNWMKRLKDKLTVLDLEAMTARPRGEVELVVDGEHI